MLPARPDEPFLGNVARMLLSPAVHQHPLLQQQQQRQGQGLGWSSSTTREAAPRRTADAGEESCSDGGASDSEAVAKGSGDGDARAGAGHREASSSGRAPKPLYGSWRAVTDNPRFLQLFPRRTSVVAQQALENLQVRVGLCSTVGTQARGAESDSARTAHSAGHVGRFQTGSPGLPERFFIYCREALYRSERMRCNVYPLFPTG